MTEGYPPVLDTDGAPEYGRVATGDAPVEVKGSR